MKKTILATAAAVLALSSCQKVEFIESDASRQGLSSLSAIFTSGTFVDQVLTTYYIDEAAYEEGYFCIPVPWYYPETTDDLTSFYMTGLRIRAELQPNFSISPKLGILDLTEENWFTLTDPKGKSRRICITGKRVHSSNAELVSFMINDMMLSCIIDKEKRELIVPYLGDLSSVTVSGQVSAHATLSKVAGKEYKEKGRYNLNEGSSVTVLADDGKTEAVYNVVQKLPEKIDMGLNEKSVSPLFNIDPVTMLGFPDYTTLSYVSLASAGNWLIVNFGDGNAPVCLNRFSAAVEGHLSTGSAVADVISNDEAEHLIFANHALGGDTAEEVRIYSIASVSDNSAPQLVGSFLNPVDVPIGYRMKVMGNIDTEAVIVFTAEGITGVTTTGKGVVVRVSNGALEGEPEVIDFSSLGYLWGAAPVGFGTIVPASVNPENDGWFVDWYGDNADSDGNYILHYVDKKMNPMQVDLVGNWADNPNCLDAKTFNGARYMALFCVSHFPCWGSGPKLYLYDISSPRKTARLFCNEAIEWTQTGQYDSEVGASGDVVLSPSADGYRLYVYYYDHHSHAIGGYVADCIKI